MTSTGQKTTTLVSRALPHVHTPGACRHTRNIASIKERRNDREEDGAGGVVPELELGEAADEGPELLVLLGWQSRLPAALHLVVLLQRRVKLGR